METGKEIVHSGALMIAKHFDDDDFEQSQSLAQLKEMLTEKIVYLMLHNMEKLLHVLYRIDIDERKVKAIFGTNNPREIAPALADLIIERELAKAESRKKHKKQ